MPRYSYRAYGATGRLEIGEVSAGSRAGALEALAARRFVPVEIDERAPGREEKWWQREVMGGGRLSTPHLAMFTRELASLVKAELPIDEALRIAAAQPALPARVKRIDEALLVAVREGRSFSDALAAEKGAFPEFYWRLVKAGEAGGSLAAVLEDLAQLLDRTAEARAQTGTALVYPAVLVVAAIVAAGVITGLLLPAIMPIFEDAGATPPAFLRALAAAHDGFASWWPVLAGLAALLAAGFLAARSNSETRAAIDRAVLHLPAVGRFVRERETARFARTFAVLVRNGVPALDAVTIAAGAARNRAYRASLAAAADEMRQGASLSQPLMRSGLYPDLFLRLAVIGEETGHLDVMHLRAAEIYEASQARQLKRITTLITPVLTLLIGLVVGGLVLSVMGAILSVDELVLK